MKIPMFGQAAPLLAAGLMLAGCASTLPPPKPEAFNFDQAEKDASAAVKQNLSVDVYGDGTKGAKKFVIGAFQVRFRQDLTGRYSVGASGNKGGASVEDTFYLAGENSALFQKVTDDLYRQFVADLKQRGIATVGLKAIQSSAEYKNNFKQELRSGFATKLVASPISCAVCDDSISGMHANGLNTLGGLANNNSDYEIFSPGEVPAVEYGLMSTHDDFDNVVLPKLLPLNRVDAATRAGMGVIAVGFEVELMKFDREEGGSAIHMSHAPMLRTKLISFKAFPPGAKVPFTLWGKPMDDGVSVEPKYRGKKRSNLIAGLFNGEVFGKQWIEIDDGAVTVDEAGGVTPVADRFPAAFKKATDPHLQMIMHVVDHEAAYK